MVTKIRLGDMAVDVVQKNIKNIHLSVNPPHGRVRIAAPLRMDLDTIRVFAISKLDWIKRQQKQLREQERESRREHVDRESHYLWGERYLLQIQDTDESPRVEVKHRRLVLRCRADSDDSTREQLLERWYRQQLKESVPPLIVKWEPRLGVTVRDWRVRRMKTKWGSCSILPQRIWLNFELVKKPAPCLEYVVVHEMAHLLERRHNNRFVALMDQSLPHWRDLRRLLNEAPLAHEDWTY